MINKKKINKIKVIFLGGLGEIGKNFIVFEYENEIIVIDCGMLFLDEEFLGIDLIIFDIIYLIKNREKIKGFFIIYGYEDYIGGLFYVLK